MNSTFEEMVKCKIIAEYYGIERQKEQAMEEMSELIQAIQKLKRCPMSIDDYKKAMDNFVEEIADVYIMICQLMILTNGEKVVSVMHEKLERQMKRIEEEKSVKVKVVEDDNN